MGSPETSVMVLRISKAFDAIEFGVFIDSRLRFIPEPCVLFNWRGTFYELRFICAKRDTKAYKLFVL